MELKRAVEIMRREDLGQDTYAEYLEARDIFINLAERYEAMENKMPESVVEFFPNDFRVNEMRKNCILASLKLVPTEEQIEDFLLTQGIYTHKIQDGQRRLLTHNLHVLFMKGLEK